MISPNLFKSVFGCNITLAMVALLLLAACSHPTTSLSTSQMKPIEQQSPANSTPVDPLLVGLSVADLEQAELLAKQRYLNSWPRIGQRSLFVRQRIVKQLDLMQAPRSLQMLPVVESTYNPYAISSSGAVGLWQLMPPTARFLGVRSDVKINGRRSVERSTRAAVTYLLQLHEQFNNWPLAFAAYNIGPYALSTRLEKRPWQAEDGLDAMPIPLATRRYVQHMIGLVALQQSGTISFPDETPLHPIQLQTPVDLIRLNMLTGMEKDTLFFYNPGLNQAQYLKNLPVTIHVPAQHAETCLSNIRAAAPQYVWRTIRKGDSLWGLARQNHISVTALQSLNPQIKTTLHIGKQIKLPSGDMAYTTEQANPLVPAARHIRYTIRSGDSLWQIARRFGTTTRAIQHYNGLNRSSNIRAGDILLVRPRNTSG